MDSGSYHITSYYGIKIKNRSGVQSSSLVECSPWDWEVVGLFPSRVIPTTMKMVPIAFLSIQAWRRLVPGWHCCCSLLPQGIVSRTNFAPFGIQRDFSFNRGVLCCNIMSGNALNFCLVQCNSLGATLRALIGRQQHTSLCKHSFSPFIWAIFFAASQPGWVSELMGWNGPVVPVDIHTNT